MTLAMLHSRKTKNMLIMLAVLLLEQVQKLYLFFQIMPKLMLAESIRAHGWNLCYLRGMTF